MKARITNVILVEEGNNQTYITLEGLEIGGFVSGKKSPPSQPWQEPVAKPKGGVVKAPTPKEVKAQKDKEADRILSTEEHLEEIKKI